MIINEQVVGLVISLGAFQYVLFSVTVLLHVSTTSYTRKGCEKSIKSDRLSIESKNLLTQHAPPIPHEPLALPRKTEHAMLGTHTPISPLVDLQDSKDCARPGKFGLRMSGSWFKVAKGREFNNMPFKSPKPNRPSEFSSTRYTIIL